MSDMGYETAWNRLAGALELLKNLSAIYKTSSECLTERYRASEREILAATILQYMTDIEREIQYLERAGTANE